MKNITNTQKTLELNGGGVTYTCRKHNWWKGYSYWNCFTHVLGWHAGEWSSIWSREIGKAGDKLKEWFN